jgi:hypothetical protein
VRLFDYIEWDGEAWQVVSAEGAEVALRALESNRIRRVLVCELLSDESFLSDATTRLPSLEHVAVLDKVDELTRERALWLYRHVHEVLHGVVPVGLTGEVPQPRPQYDLSNTLEARLKAKSVELAAGGVSMSTRSLHRHVRAYRREGIAGLVDGRHVRSKSPFGRMHPEVVTLVREAVKGQTLASTGTRSRVITQVRLRASERGLPVPGQTTMYRVLKTLELHQHPFGDATTRRTQAARPERTYGRQSPLRPGELVEIDSNRLDVMVVFPDGSTGRPDLTVAIDVATRTPLVGLVRPEATKAVDAAVLLAKALTPLVLQPGWSKSLAYSRSILPVGMLPDDARVRADAAARPVIVPENITIDRGNVYVGHTFKAACERLQIGLIKASPLTPTDKPHIERFFSAVNSGFTQYLAGYTGSNVARRGQDPASEAVFALGDIQNLLDWWFVTVWQNRPHNGLRSPAMPDRDLTPNEMFAALSSVAPQVSVVMTRDDYICLMPIAWRTIQAYGINFEGLAYDHPSLHPYRGVSSGLTGPAAGKWEVRYDPYRLTSIFVRDHFNDCWIEAEWTMAALVAAPFSLDVLNAAKAALMARPEADSDSAGDQAASRYPGMALLKEINRITTAPASRAERTSARRASTTQPSVPPADGQDTNTAELTGGQDPPGTISDNHDDHDHDEHLAPVVPLPTPSPRIDNIRGW